LLPIEVSLLITMICICLMSRLTDCRKDGFVNYIARAMRSPSDRLERKVSTTMQQAMCHSESVASGKQV
jgi:hypothetical protein